LVIVRNGKRLGIVHELSLPMSLVVT